MRKEQEWYQDGYWIKKIYILLILINFLFLEELRFRDKIQGKSRYFGKMSKYRETQGLSLRGVLNKYQVVNDRNSQ